MIRIPSGGNICDGLIQPVQRIRQGHEKGLQSQQDFFRLFAFIPALQKFELRFILRFRLLTCFLEGSMKQLHPLGSVADLKIRINLRQLELVFQQLLAEGMDGGDLHQIHLIQGGPDIRVSGFPDQPLPDSFPHLRSGSIGEGHDEKAVGFRPLPKEADDSFHHHRRFPAAGRGAADDFPGIRPDHPQLFFSPFRHAILHPSLVLT